MTDLTTLSAEELDAQIEALTAEKARREAEPDPLLIEAREIAATICEEQDHLDTAEFVRTCDPSNSTTLAASLAALRRGMELAPLIPTPEIDVEAQARAIAESRGITGASNLVSIRADEYRSDLARAIRETIRLLGHAPKGERLTDEDVRGFVFDAVQRSSSVEGAVFQFANILREKGYLP